MRLLKPKLIELPKIADSRGYLSFVQNLDQIPFSIQRVYYLYDVPKGQSRGAHAHYELEQLILAISGSFDLTLDDGLGSKFSFNLSNPSEGVLVPKMHWREITNFDSGSVCLVLASLPYQEEDYIRDYETFRKTAVSRRG